MTITNLDALNATKITGESVPIRSFSFQTPSELPQSKNSTSKNSGDIFYHFSVQSDVSSARVPFEQIRQVTIRRQEDRAYPSRAEEMEFLFLGSKGKAIPPPPDWKHAFGSQPAWHAAAKVQPGTLVPFVNGVEYCWAPKADGQPQSGDFLFRQQLRLGDLKDLARAELCLSGSVEFLGVFLNERPVHLAGKTQLGICEFEITPLIRPGDNLLALRVRSLNESRIEQPCIAFDIKTRRVPPAVSSAYQSGSALMIESEGDRVWGRVEGMEAQKFRMKSEYGPVEISWDKVHALLFPEGFVLLPRSAKGGMGQKIQNWVAIRDHPKNLESRGQGLPTQSEPVALGGTLLLSEGRAYQGWVGKIEGDRLNLVLAGDRSIPPVRTDELLAVYPRASDSSGTVLLQKPSPDVAPIFCRATTSRGEIISGLLRQATGRGIVLESRHGEFLKLPANQLVEISFPYHISINESQSNGSPAALEKNSPDAPRIQIGVLGRAGGLEEHAQEYSSLSNQIQEAAFIAGFDSILLSEDSLTNPSSLSPSSFPILASIDPVGEYLDSMNEQGDVRKLLVAYVESGGCLLLYSRGGALRTAVLNAPGGFLRSPRPEGLARQFEFKTFHPGDESPSGIIPFDRPSSEAGLLTFDRSDVLPENFPGLPKSISLASMLLAPFYPMVDVGGHGKTIYRLRGSDKDFGPALTLTPRGKGKIVVIDHLLWHSKVDDEPFTTAVLPSILRWQLDQAKH